MKLFAKYSTAVTLVLIAFFSASAQDFSNRGKEFWVAYPAHIDGTGSVMGIYITSSKNTSGQVNAAGNIIPFTITANQVSRVFLGGGGNPTNTGVYLNMQDGIKSNAAIKITADDEVVVYTHIIRSARSGATLALPTPVLGIEYIVTNYGSVTGSSSTGDGSQGGISQFAVVATQSNTVIEITPKANGIAGRPAGVPFQITLPNAGDCYQFQSVQLGDLSGTTIKSISSGGGGCKPVAVFSGSTWSNLDCAGASGGDNLYQQLFPNRSWGKQFVTAPFRNRPSDIYRVYVQDPATVVTYTENGITNTFGPGQFNTNGRFYQYKTANPLLISGDKPIQVVQYITSQNCKTSCPTNSSNPTCYADPEMVVLNSIEQTLDTITFFSAHQSYVPAGQTNVVNHFVNLIINRKFKNSVRIDGAAPTGTFVDIPGTNYSYLQEDVSASSAFNPVHRVTADTGFSAIVYGFGSVESYGYNGGTNVRDLSQFVSTTNQFASVNSPVACKSSPFLFAITLPYIPLSINWTIPGYPNYINNSPTPDSTYMLNGRQLYVFKVPGSYIYNTVGTYPVSVTVNNPTPDGCSGIQTIPFPLQVFDNPKADFSWPSLPAYGCTDSVLTFTTNNNGFGRPVAKHYWSFGDNTFSSINNANKIYTAPGEYTIRYAIMTDIGCLSDTVSKVIKVTKTPVAKFGFTNPQCPGNPITFGDTSSLPGGYGTIVNWNWNLGNSTILNNPNGNSVTTTYPAVTSYTASLQLTSSTGCLSPVVSLPVTINPKPVPNFTNLHGCLPDGIVNFTGTSTISDGTQNLFSYVWNFGDPASGALNTASIKDPSHRYPSTGPFQVKLIVTSNKSCVDSITKPITNIYPQPKAGINAPAEVCFQTPVTFLDQTNGITHPVTRWEWRFKNASGTEIGSSTVKDPVYNFPAPGTYLVQHWAFTDQNCVSDTVQVSITINPWPTTDFATSSILCEKNSITFSNSSDAQVGNLIRWYWNLGDGTIINSTNGNTFNHIYTSWGNKTIKLLVENSKGCKSDTVIRTIAVNPLPVPGFSNTYACLPDGVVNFTDTSKIADATQNQFTYLWNFGDASSGSLNNSTLKNPSHKYPSTGPFTVKLIVTSNSSCIDSVQKSISNIYPQPKAGINAPAEVCFQTPVSFLDQTNGITHPVTRWEWRFKNASGAVIGSSTVKDPVYNFPAPGTYFVQHWAFTNQNCVSDTVELPIVINPWPTASFSLNTPACEKNTVVFNSTAQPNAGTLVRWYWNLGDGTIINASANSPVSHTYTNWGNKTIKMLVESSKGCKSDTLTQTVLINPLPKIGYILPEVCLTDGFATFNDTSKIADGSASQLSYLWSFNTGAVPVTPAPNPLTSTQKNPTIQIFTAANYALSLRVQSKDGCVDSVTNIPFTVNGVIAKTDYRILPTNGLCSNREIEIQNKSTVVFGWLTKVEIYWDWANNPTQVEVDDNPAVDEIYKHSYPNFQSPLTRTYRVRMRAFSGVICEKDTIQDIVVNASPLTTFAPIPGICVDAAPRQITQARETGGLPVGSEVYSGPGVSPSGLFDPAAAGVGIHTIRYTFTAQNGCTHFSESQVEVWPRPVAKLSTAAPFCEKNAITFNSTGSVANATNLATWQWNFGDGTPVVTTTNSNPVNHTYAVYGNYTAQLTVTNNRGCNSLPEPLQVKINPLPKVEFQLPKICLPDGRGQFTDRSAIADNTQAGFSYRWNFGNTFASPAGSDTSSAKNPVYKYSNLGPYNVKLIVRSTSNCVDSLTQQLVDVFPQPKARIKSSSDSICIGQTIDFTDESDGVVRNIGSWKWSFGNGDSSFIQNPRYRYPAAATVPYTVKLFVYTTEGCVSDTAEKQINVWSYPVVSAGPDITMLQDGIRKIAEARSTGNGLQYLWTPSTYLDNSASANPTIVKPQDDITYTVRVTGRGGCTNSDAVFVKVLKMPKPPNTFTPNGDGINDFWEIKYLNDYPGCIVEVYNTAGTLVYRSVGYSTPWDGKFNGQPLPAGTYYYVIDPKNGRSRVAGYITILR